MERLTGLPEIKLTATAQATGVLILEAPTEPLQVVDVPALKAGWREAVQRLLAAPPTAAVKRVPLGQSEEGGSRYEALVGGAAEEDEAGAAAEAGAVNERAARLLLDGVRGPVLVTKVKVDPENDFLGYLSLGLEELGGLNFFRVRRTTLAAAGTDNRFIRDVEGGDPALEWRMRSCCWCRKAGSKGAPALRCSRCGRAIYCSPECQRSDWRYHKVYCRSNA